jgi:hypothetical protein
MSELENKPLEELKPEEQLQEVRLETSDESLAEEIVNQNEVEPVQLIEPEDVGISETENEIISETLTPEPVATETEIPEAIIEALPEVTSNVERDEHDESEVDSHEDSDDEFVSLTDYSTFSRQEIVDVLKQKLESSLIQKLKPEIDNLKLHFYRKIKLEVEAARKRFVEDGGKIEEFKAEPDEIEIAFKEHLNIYKNHRDQFRLKSENEKVDNLSRKLAIIEEIKNLPNDHDSINKTFNTFREIQRHWREVGPVPQAELNNLYETYNYHV